MLETLTNNTETFKIQIYDKVGKRIDKSLFKVDITDLSKRINRDRKTVKNELIRGKVHVKRTKHDDPVI
jgi:hypothetical protein